MQVFAITIPGIKKEVSKVFKVEVTELAKTYRVDKSPYTLGYSLLHKLSEYKPIGYPNTIMYGTDKDKLIKAWSELAELEEHKEMSRHVKRMEEIRAKLYIMEEF